jgi:hypothetical protein
MKKFSLQCHNFSIQFPAESFEKKNVEMQLRGSECINKSFPHSKMENSTIIEASKKALDSALIEFSRFSTSELIQLFSLIRFLQDLHKNIEPGV